MHDKAIILLSGGLDSATTLAIARHDGYLCHALSFDYGQRHSAELQAARRIADSLAVHSHKIITLDLIGGQGSALTDLTMRVPIEPGEGIPVTYVPARNIIFLSLALGYAEVVGARDIFIGVNAVDYSGYPDCRPEFITAYQEMADIGTRSGTQGKGVRIRTPIIDLSKAEIIRRGQELGVDYALTVSCYQADSQGRSCGVCESCRLRKQGFAAAEVPDPTTYRT